MNTTIFIDAHDPPDMVDEFCKIYVFFYNNFDLFVVVIFLFLGGGGGGGGVGKGV